MYFEKILFFIKVKMTIIKSDYIGDILLLSYNSDFNELSFKKENDNGKLNSFIKNLPKNQTFYWFVAHSDVEPMSVSIV